MVVDPRSFMTTRATEVCWPGSAGAGGISPRQPLSLRPSGAAVPAAPGPGRLLGNRGAVPARPAAGGLDRSGGQGVCSSSRITMLAMNNSSWGTPIWWSLPLEAVFLLWIRPSTSALLDQQAPPMEGEREPLREGPLRLRAGAPRRGQGRSEGLCGADVAVPGLDLRRC